MSEPFGQLERDLLYEVLRIAYEHGGDLDEDKRLIEYCYLMLDTANPGCDLPTLGMLQEIRAEVIRDIQR